MKVNSTDSSLSGEESLYHSDAKGASCLLLQQKVIATQALNVEKYLKEGVLVQQKHCIESVESNPQDILPKLLSNRMEDSGNGRRNGESENGNEGGGEKSKKEERVMDDVEVSIMGILDSDGKITVKTRLTEFMGLMTRVEKVDHRALCLLILSKHLSETCEHEFVLEGGYRLLKQWVKTAQEQKCINEIKSILKLLKKLPYYSEKLLSCNFQPEFKSLRSFEGGALKKQLDALISALKSKAPAVPPSSIARNNQADSVPLTQDQKNMTEAMREKMMKERGEPEVRVPSPIQAAPSSPATAPKPVGMKLVSMSKPATTTESKASAPVARNVGLNVVKAATKTPSVPAVSAPAIVAQNAAPTVAASSVNSAPIPRASSKNKVDMGAIARKAADEAHRKAKDDASAARDAKPGKGGLKRSYSDIGDDADSKDDKKARKVKRSVKWADAEGHQLKYIKEYEIDPSTAVLSRRSKDSKEKEDKVEWGQKVSNFDMQKKCEWMKPEKLGWLGDVEEIREIANDAFESPESEIIKARLDITPDASYPDVILIPNDPEKPDRASQQLDVKGVSTVHVEVVFTSGPVGGPSTVPEMETFFQPLAAEYRPEQNILASVPEQLHFLEHAVLAKLAIDATLIAPLLKHDGTPNMEMVNQFRIYILGPTVAPMMPPPAPPKRKSRFSA